MNAERGSEGKTNDRRSTEGWLVGGKAWFGVFIRSVRICRLAASWLVQSGWAPVIRYIFTLIYARVRCPHPTYSIHVALFKSSESVPRDHRGQAHISRRRRQACSALFNRRAPEVSQRDRYCAARSPLDYIVALFPRTLQHHRSWRTSYPARGLLPRCWRLTSPARRKHTKRPIASRRVRTSCHSLLPTNLSRSH